MAKYTSKYPALMFYAGEKVKRFSNGEFTTDDPEIIAVLDALTDVVCVDAPKPKPEAKPAPKKPAKQAASDK